jgi:hypothetical protein
MLPIETRTGVPGDGLLSTSQGEQPEWHLSAYIRKARRMADQAKDQRKEKHRPSTDSALRYGAL